MSADSFHHKVELAMKHSAKVYDFDDFVSNVAVANKTGVDVLAMKINNFCKWPNHSSTTKL